MLVEAAKEITPLGAAIASIQWDSESYSLLGDPYTAICIQRSNRRARTPLEGTLAPAFTKSVITPLGKDARVRIS